MIGFWKIDQSITLYRFHFICPANSYTHTLPVYNGIFSSINQLAEIVIKHWLKDYSAFTVNLAWLQSSTRDHGGSKYFKLVFLKIPHVTTTSVLQNQVTHVGGYRLVSKVWKQCNACSSNCNASFMSLIITYVINNIYINPVYIIFQFSTIKSLPHEEMFCLTSY